MSAILHLLSRSANQGDSLHQCLRQVTDGDALVLLEEAVVEALEGARSSAALKRSGAAVYVLQAELDLRGLSQSSLTPGITPIDYETLVSLVVDFGLSQTWS